MNDDVNMSTEQTARVACDSTRDSLSPTLTLLTTGQEVGDPTSQAREGSLLINRLVISYTSTNQRILIDAKIVNMMLEVLQSLCLPQLVPQHEIIQFLVEEVIEMEFCAELQTILCSQLWVCPVTIPRDKGSEDPSLRERDHVSKPSATRPQRTFHHIHTGCRIWAASTSHATIGSGLGDDVEVLGIDEKHVDVPHRVKYQTDLCEVKTWRSVSGCGGDGIISYR